MDNPRGDARRRRRRPRGSPSFEHTIVLDVGIYLDGWKREKKRFQEVARIRSHFGLDPFLSDESEEKSIYSVSSESTMKGADELKRVGVDSLMGNKEELFGIGLNILITLEKRLTPAGLGKKQSV